MGDIIIRADLFRDARDFKRSRDALMHILDAITKIDEDYLREFPETPTLYGSGVVYRRTGPKEWFDIATTISMGWGDCKDFSAWRVAELRRAGESGAKCWLKHVTDVKPDGSKLYAFHVVVSRRSQGKVWLEDPSRVLGMGLDPPLLTPQEAAEYEGVGGALPAKAQKRRLVAVSTTGRR